MTLNELGTQKLEQVYSNLLHAQRREPLTAKGSRQREPFLYKWGLLYAKFRASALVVSSKIHNHHNQYH